MSMTTLSAAVARNNMVEEGQADTRNWDPKNDIHWTAEQYADVSFRNWFTGKFLDRRIEETLVMLRKFARTTDGYDILCRSLLMRFSLDGSIPVKILSMGCGPGSDAIALMRLLRTGPWGFTASFDITLIDREPCWEDTAVAAVKDDLVPALGDRVTFMQGTWDDPLVMTAAVEADYIIISHVLVDAVIFGEGKAAGDFISNALEAWRSTSDPRSSVDFPCPKMVLWIDRFPPDKLRIINTDTRWTVDFMDTTTTSGVRQPVTGSRSKTRMGVMPVEMTRPNFGTDVYNLGDGLAREHFEQFSAPCDWCWPFEQAVVTM